MIPKLRAAEGTPASDRREKTPDKYPWWNLRRTTPLGTAKPTWPGQAQKGITRPGMGLILREELLEGVREKSAKSQI